MQNIRYIEPEVFIFNEDGFHDVSEFAQTIFTQNSLDMPVGTAHLSFNPSNTGKLSTNITHNKILNHVKKLLKINSIISIKIDKFSKTHTFLGRIDHRYESIVANNNTNSRALKVNASMMLPKLLIRDFIANSPALSESEEMRKFFGERINFFKWGRGATTKGGNVFAAEPIEAVKWILENAVATNSTVLSRDPNSTTGLIAKTFFDPKKKTLENGDPMLILKFLKGEYLFDSNLTTYSGNILEYLHAAIDLDFYEMFFDTETGDDGLAYNSMTIRPKPFSYTSYNSPVDKIVLDGWQYFDSDLRSVTKNSSQRIQEDLGVSDFDLKNFFSVNFTQSLVANANNALGKFGVQFPMLLKDSIKRNGLRQLQLTSKMVHSAGWKQLAEKYNAAVKENRIEPVDKIADETGLINMLLEKREKAYEWNAFPYFESGQVQWVGDESLKIGKKLIYEDKEYFHEEEEKVYKGVHYYIKSVNHQFGYGSFYKTLTGLTKGAPEGVAPNWLNENRKNIFGVNKSIQKEYQKAVAKANSIFDERTKKELDDLDKSMFEMKSIA